MKQIAIRNRKREIIAFTVVDDEDYDAVCHRSWSLNDSKNRYPVTREKGGKKTYLHRLIAKTPPGMDTDHIDGNPLNNTRANLRVCTTSQNLCNKIKCRNNTSGHKGIYWHKQVEKWCAYIEKDGKRHSLGLHSSIEKALAAYSGAEMRLHGEFALSRRNA